MTVAPLRPGDPERLGPYRITGRLGQGGQGIVYHGHGPGGERVAVKTLTGDLDRSFERELAAAQKVADFCTARVIAADLGHDPPYVASEYIDGPPLSAVAPLRGAALMRLAIATATALTAIHRAGVVHRDLKPANVLMASGGPRVIDFGIARLVDSSTTSGGLSGTPRYMAPEQFAGGPVGPAADVFAWGCTMVFAATGRPAFGGDALPAAIHRILHGEPDLSGLAEPLRGTVARCLAKDPARRPAARDLLLELLGENRPAAEQEATPARVSRRTVLIGAGAVTAALGTAGAVLWGRVLPGGRTGALTSSSPSTSPASGTSPSPSTTPAPSTPTRTASSRTSAAPPSPDPRRLASALQDAMAVTPLADFTHEGGLSQSNVHAEATGRLAYRPHADGYNSVDYAMTLARPGRSQAVLITAGPGQGLYLDGRKVAEEDDSDTAFAARMVAMMTSVGVAADTIALTGKIRRDGRTYAGSLDAHETPPGMQLFLQEIANWEREQLARSTLSWRLTLDAADRPRAYTLAWRAPIEGAVLASTWSTTYRRWRAGTITPPQ
ncbi:serine/threonine-protein kinase [Nonomuraea sp. NPDC049649]|uniref:serine/threonine-protein kinase n=1 Tax=Nonomuraea sp. NPDC049649 TaxID=3155776 RepID=UPI0034457193